MKTHFTFFRLLNISGLICALSLTSCTPLQQQGAGVGALAGGALGALAGDDDTDVVRATAIGAALGAGVAALREQQQYNNGYYNPSNDVQAQTQQTTTPVQNSSNYPLAQMTETPGYVKSPYSPYNTVDVRGIPAGKMAKEPGTDHIFIIP